MKMVHQDALLRDGGVLGAEASSRYLPLYIEGLGAQGVVKGGMNDRVEFDELTPTNNTKNEQSGNIEARKITRTLTIRQKKIRN